MSRPSLRRGLESEAVMIADEIRAYARQLQ
jgi:hypothetical protein